MKNIEINGRNIGPEYPPYIICELSGNHNGSLERALQMIDEAARTGCDAIKIQTYTPDTLTINCDKPDFKITSGPWAGDTLYSLYSSAHTPFEWHEKLFARAASHNITLFSTPFDETAADLLDQLGTPAYKIASFELNDLELISYVAGKRRPMIMSTGLASCEDIAIAVDTAKANGCDEIILLHCISAYPAPTAESNLRTISDMQKRFKLNIGLSDHTLGTATSVAAVALGASVIEKHFALSRSLEGPDSSFSLEPDEFSKLCSDCRDAWISLGEPSYNVKSAERPNLIFRRSVYAVNDINEGEEFTRQNLRVIRPGYGLDPGTLPSILGRKSSRAIAKGTALEKCMVLGLE